MTKQFIACLTMFAATALMTGCLGGRSTQLDEKQRVITDLNERALAFAELHRETDARKLLQDALQMATALDDQSGQITTLLNLARLDRHTNRLQSAAQLLDQAMQRAGGTAQYADLAQEKSLQELTANRLDQAERWAEEAVATEQGNLQGRRRNLLARIALLKGDLHEATAQAEQALSLNSANGMELERANSLRILGLSSARRQQFEKAEGLLLEALELDKQQAASLKIAADLEALAELAGLKKDTAGQQDYSKRAQAVRESSVSRPQNR